MKKKIGEWLDLNSAISDLLNGELSGTLALRAAMAQETISDKLKAFEKKRQELFKKHGEEDKEAGTIQVKKDKMPDFMAEFQPLLEMDVSIDIQKIPKTEIETAGTVKGTLIRNLLPLIGD